MILVSNRKRSSSSQEKSEEGSSLTKSRESRPPIRPVGESERDIWFSSINRLKKCARRRGPDNRLTITERLSDVRWFLRHGKIPGGRLGHLMKRAVGAAFYEILCRCYRDSRCGVSALGDEVGLAGTDTSFTTNWCSRAG